MCIRDRTYIGQDSYKSGYIAAKILMRNYSAGEGQELVLFLSNNKDNPAEIQMQRRLDGFMSYIAEEYNNLVCLLYTSYTICSIRSALPAIPNTPKNRMNPSTNTNVCLVSLFMIIKE